MSESTLQPSARPFGSIKTEQEMSKEDTSNLKTIETHQQSFGSIVTQLKNYIPQSNLIDLADLKKAKNVKIKKSKGFAFFGQFIDKEKSGLGIILYENGRVYEGSWKNDQKDGQGYEKYASGNIYLGKYSKGKPEGMGKYYWTNGQMYEGEWIDGVRQGSGTWRGVKNDSYIGQWNNGKPEGFGVLLWPNGDRYQGYFKEGLKDGEGFQKYSSGDLYRGAFSEGKKCGYGQYFWKNGTYYKGTFSNGLRQGSGVWQSSKGDTYQGQYKNGKKQGYGIYSWPNGTVYKGNFKQDFRQGYGEMLWSDGSFYKGGWKQDKQEGIGQIYSHVEGLKKCRLSNNTIVEIIDQEFQSKEKGRIMRSNIKQNKFNKMSRQPKQSGRYRENSTHETSFKKVVSHGEGMIKRTKTEGTNDRYQWKSAQKYQTFHNNTTNTYQNSHFKLNPSKMKKNTIQLKSCNRSTSRKQHLPHSSIKPHQMDSNIHRRTKTAYDQYPEDSRVQAISQRPYNLTKLMHKFKLVRSISKQQ